jgi:tRNA nucleotidyltransferase (CCA-adding enzyme)
MTRPQIDASSLRDRFYREVAQPQADFVRRIVAEAGGHVWLAAGMVRDLLLNRPLDDADVDLVTELDAIAIARGVAPDGEVTAHERFGTATIEAGGHRVDLARARTETYVAPGALPDVRPSTVEDDLRRRDFTMNALALSLDGEAVLLDPLDGRNDIERRQVRVLHDASFRDDATRIFRAFRYAARLGFDVEPHTRSLIDEGTGYVATISGERLRHELHLLFDEPTGGVALEALDGAGALQAIHPTIRWCAHHSDAGAELRGEAADTHACGFALLAAETSVEDALQIAERLSLAKEEAAAVRGMAGLRATADLLRRNEAKPSGVVTVLDRFPEVSIRAFAALTEDATLARVLHRYLDEWRDERPILTGHDLMALGVPEGPHIKRGLQLIRAARLDGWASDRDDERALIMRFAKSIRDSRAMNQPIDFKLYEN